MKDLRTTSYQTDKSVIRQLRLFKSYDKMPQRATINRGFLPSDFTSLYVSCFFDEGKYYFVDHISNNRHAFNHDMILARDIFFNVSESDF